MVTVSVESQAEREQGIHDVVRTITLAGLVTISAAAYDFYVSGLPGETSAFQFFQVGTLIALLTSVIVASWLGLVASSRWAVGLIYGLISLFLITVVANLLFVVEAPTAVGRYTPWIIATLIIPFLTVGRSFARVLGGTFVLSMLLLIGAHVLRIGANPFTEPCCADLILFSLALIVAFVLLDGFAMFREAAIKFHARSDALEEHAAEMQQAFEEAEAAREQSEIARKEAEKSIKLRETFLATMSHELRTPLNAIIGFSQVMKSDALGDGEGATEQYRTYAEDIHQSGEHVLSLINQLLEYSRIRSGTFDLNPTDLQLDEVVQFVHRMSLSTAKAKGVELGIQIASDCNRKVRADRQALIQIGLNLVGNALSLRMQVAASHSKSRKKMMVAYPLVCRTQALASRRISLKRSASRLSVLVTPVWRARPVPGLVLQLSRPWRRQWKHPSPWRAKKEKGPSPRLCCHLCDQKPLRTMFLALQQSKSYVSKDL